MVDTEPRAAETRRDRMSRELRRNRRTLMGVGIALVILGALALIFPGVSTLVTEQAIGWLFLFAAIVLLIVAFTYEGLGAKIAGVLLAIVSGALGLLLIFNPVTGVFALTFALTALFVVDALYRFSQAFAMRGERGWGWMLLGGLASAALAAAILLWLPASGRFALGIVVGVYFIAIGGSMIGVSAAYREEPAPADRA